MKKIVLLALGLSISLCWASSETKHKHKHVEQSNYKENRVPAPIMDEELNPAKRPTQW